MTRGIFMQAGVVAWRNKGVLISGAPNTGKSRLAWQLITQHGGILVADDGVRLHDAAPIIAYMPHPPLLGHIALREIGIKQTPAIFATPLTHKIHIGILYPNQPPFLQVLPLLNLNDITNINAIMLFLMA